MKMNEMPIYEKYAWKTHSLYKKKMKKLKRLYKKVVRIAIKKYVIDVLMESTRLKEWEL